MASEASDLKHRLQESKCQGLVLDIDETLAATNVAWFQRLSELFGRPADTSIEQLIDTYHLAQQVPHWQTAEAEAWMVSQRSSPEAQDGLPIIPGALEGVRRLQELTEVVGYLTVRPDSVAKNTMAWLKASGFPDLPLLCKPDAVPFLEGNAWKAKMLQHLWPEVLGIVDDNPKLPELLLDYPGLLFWFSHEGRQAIPCPDWPSVVRAANRMPLTLRGPVPLLSGPRLQLRPYAADDVDELQKQADNLRVARMLRPIFPHPYTRADAEFWVSFCKEQSTWAISLDGKVIGNIGLMKSDIENWDLPVKAQRFGELGYWLGEDYWGKGFASEAVSILLSYLRPYRWLVAVRVAAGNAASRRVIEKAGFAKYRRVAEAEEPHPVNEERRRLDCDDFWMQL